MALLKSNAGSSTFASSSRRSRNLERTRPKSKSQTNACPAGCENRPAPTAGKRSAGPAASDEPAADAAAADAAADAASGSGSTTSSQIEAYLHPFYPHHTTLHCFLSLFNSNQLLR